MTCPGGGIFVFTWTIQANLTTRAAAALVVDGAEYMLGPLSYNGDLDFLTPNSGTSSTTAVVQCTAGRILYVEGRQTDELYPSNIFDAGATSLTGYRVGNAGTIAFTARTTQPQEAEEGKSIIYDEELINVGGHYQSTTGKFVCPDDDYYFFTWSVLNDQRVTFTHLEMDGNVIKEGPSTSYTGGGGQQGVSGTSSMSTVFQCSAGSQVGVVFSSQRWGGVTLDPFYNTLSGWKVPRQDN